jgi:D-amino-acid dehydrogenase
VLHLQTRARAVVLLNRRDAAEETSFKNAGLIQREGVYPYVCPHDFRALALCVQSYDPRVSSHGHRRISRRFFGATGCIGARRYAKLIEHCVSEHDALARETARAAFSGAPDGSSPCEHERDKHFVEVERVHREFEIRYRALSTADLQDIESHLAPELSVTIHHLDSISVDGAREPPPATL